MTKDNSSLTDVLEELSALKHVTYSHLGAVQELKDMVGGQDSAYHSVKWRYLGLIFLLGSLVGYCARPAHSATLRVDQPRPTCSKREVKRWAKDYETLSPEQLHWQELSSHSTKTLDFTGDTVPDTLEVVATQYVRDCNLLNDVPFKEVQVTLTNGATHHKILWNWKGGLPDHYRVDLGTKEINLEGTNYDSTRWERTLHY